MATVKTKAPAISYADAGKYAEMPLLTDIDVGLTDQLLARGWVWQFAWNEADGWHHTITGPDGKSNSDDSRSPTT